MIKNVKSSRLSVCRWLFYVALGCLALNANASPFKKGSPLRIEQSGNQVKVGEGSMSARPSSEIRPMSTPIGNSGWWVGTAPAGSETGPTMTMGRNGEAFFAGTKYNFQAGWKPTASDIAGGALSLVGGPWGAALGIVVAGAPALAEWLRDNGSEPNPAATGPDDAWLSASDGSDTGSGFPYSCNPAYHIADNHRSCTAERTCELWASAVPGLKVYVVPYYINGQPLCNTTGESYGGNIISRGGNLGSNTPPAEPYTAQRAISDAVRRAWDGSNFPSADALDDIIRGGGEIDFGSQKPEVTGPSTVPGQTTTSTTQGTDSNGQPTTTVTTTTETKHFTTNNNTINNTHNTSRTTTTVTNNITNTSSTTVIDTEETPKQEDKTKFCEENPDSLACAELDEVEEEVPEETINIDYEYTDLFGNGVCPPDSYATVGGQNLKVWDWQSTCSNVSTYFQGVLIACCAFAAFVIVAGGAKE